MTKEEQILVSNLGWLRAIEHKGKSIHLVNSVALNRLLTVHLVVVRDSYVYITELGRYYSAYMKDVR